MIGENGSGHPVGRMAMEKRKSGLLNAGTAWKGVWWTGGKPHYLPLVNASVHSEITGRGAELQKRSEYHNVENIQLMPGANEDCHSGYYRRPARSRLAETLSRR
jgi:hypothetical protein